MAEAVFDEGPAGGGPCVSHLGQLVALTQAVELQQQTVVVGMMVHG